VFGREAHVNEVQVERFACGLAVLGRPMAVRLFVYMECLYCPVKVFMTTISAL